jgi:hypothetical protein
VNYHRWSVCEEARKLGKCKKSKLYLYLKEPLIRKFGAEWYGQLLQVAEEYVG